MFSINNRLATTYLSEGINKSFINNQHEWHITYFLFFFMFILWFIYLFYI